MINLYKSVSECLPNIFLLIQTFLLVEAFCFWFRPSCSGKVKYEDRRVRQAHTPRTSQLKLLTLNFNKLDV